MSALKNVEKTAGHDRPADTWEFEPLGSALHVECCGRTDTGRVRPNNEDQFVVAELAKMLRVLQTSLPEPRVQSSGRRGHLLVVADGMGGHAGGAEASRIAARTIEECVLDSMKWFLHAQGGEGEEVAESLRAAVESADARVRGAAIARPDLHGMGTTLTLAFQVGRELFVAHVGDTRAYLYRDGRLHRLTKDHTLLAELTRAGALPEGAHDSKRLRHVVTNAVGGTEPGVRVELVRARVEPGDRVLLCSDGLTDMLDDAAIAEVLAECAEPGAACDRLVEAANARGGRDNVTVIVATFQEVAA